MQVRYQAAPRPDILVSPVMAPERRRIISESTARRQPGGAFNSTTQDAQDLFQLDPHLPHDLLRLRQILTRLIAL